MTKKGNDVMCNFKPKEKFLTTWGLVTLMDVRLVAFDKLPILKKRVLGKLGEIQANINWNKQPKLKFDKEAQANVMSDEEDKRYLKKMLKEINDRLKEGV